MIPESKHLIADSQHEDPLNVAMLDGRHEEALRLIIEVFDQVAAGTELPPGQYFITMFNWKMLIEDYPPAREALISKRDEQIRHLLNGDYRINAGEFTRPNSRFDVITSMNRDLGDSRSTYEVFVQLESTLPDQAKRGANLALPAMVEFGDFVRAQSYLSDPLPRLEELNRLAKELPLFPEPGKAPRLAAELSIYMRDVILLSAVHEGLGREAEAAGLRHAAIAGIADDGMRALAQRELAEPESILREISNRVPPPDGPGLARS
jgi:hypothetical protein